MTEKRDLITKLNQKTGVDYYKLKRLSTSELAQILEAFAEERKNGRTEERKILQKEIEYLVEQLNINQPTARELADRQMNKDVVRLLDYLWSKITGQPEMPDNIWVLVSFGTVLGLIFLFAVFGIPVYIGRFFGWWE